MKKLELKDICGYFPYGLNICIWDEGINAINEISVIGGVHNNKYLDTTEDIGDSELWDIDIDIIKPILRPISDMSKTITHEDKEIIPIVECAKITFPNCSWKLADKIPAAESYDNHIHWFFMYDNYDGFKFRYNSGISDVRNQCKLFDYLNELKIDYRGLIVAGLAIDCNTIENNPYN
jgi:hypothetical protein